MSDHSLTAAAEWLKKFDDSLTVIPRAQLETLMAAAAWVKGADEDRRCLCDRCEKRRAILAALRAASIPDGE